MFLVGSLPLSPAVLQSSYSLEAPFTLSYNVVSIYPAYFAFHNAMLLLLYPFSAAVQEDKTPQGSGTAFAPPRSTTLPRLSISKQTCGLTTTASPVGQTNCCASVLLCFANPVQQIFQLIYSTSVKSCIFSQSPTLFIPDYCTTIVVITHTPWRSPLILLLIDIDLYLITLVVPIDNRRLAPTAKLFSGHMYAVYLCWLFFHLLVCFSLFFFP